jgi:hypothetical protein
MRQRMHESPLMDGPAFAHDFQSILRQIWRSRCYPDNAW